ncbi:MAG TPA: serine--tRNA ligase [Armatimonadota bacterium]|nr:serine--tRNA ligase [Armatimonadota bacterium]
MIDLRLLRENPDLFREASRKKRIPADVDAVVETDTRLRALRVEVENLRSERNRVSKSVGKKQGEEREAALEEARTLRERLEESEPELKSLEDRLNGLLLTIPNVPAPEVPEGATDEDNVELRRWGAPREFSFAPKDHVELALSLDIADFGRGSKVSGSRFYFLKNEGALLQMALLRYAVDVLVQRGLSPMIVPELVREEAMTGTGFFPTGREDSYTMERDDLYLVGTSEVSLVSFHSDEILSLEELPRRYAGLSSCFRREAGAAGKDTRGFYRVHQFQKVEQVVICESEPEVVQAEHLALLTNVEFLLQSLGLPHRVALACAGELGMGQVLKHEVETWMPSRAAYSETHSCSTLGEYQSRRLNIRYRNAEGQMRFCATLNNTAVASPRILIPLLETYQQEDGSVKIPEVLHPYLHGITEIRPK